MGEFKIKITEIKNRIGAGPKEKRIKNDFYPTPDCSTNDLLDREKFEGTIWEPACGDGAISKLLIQRGYEVYSSDLIDRGYGDAHFDFLLHETPHGDNIITNPPFKFATEFTLHSLKLAKKKVIMFGQLTFLEGSKRKDKLFSQNHLRQIYVFSKRQPMNGIGSMIAFAWYVFDKEYQGKPTLEWI